jgi:hypothetical protein
MEIRRMAIQLRRFGSCFIDHPCHCILLFDYCRRPAAATAALLDDSLYTRINYAHNPSRITTEENHHAVTTDWAYTTGRIASPKASGPTCSRTAPR